MTRGVINNRAAAQKIRDFSGLRFGNITPTDIDAFIDFGDRLFVLIEGKYKDSKPPRGQMLALERLADACHCPPRRYATVILVSHDGEDVDVDFAKCVVRAFRWNRKWHKPRVDGLNLRDALNSLLEFYEKPKLKLVGK